MANTANAVEAAVAPWITIKIRQLETRETSASVSGHIGVWHVGFKVSARDNRGIISRNKQARHGGLFTDSRNAAHAGMYIVPVCRCHLPATRIESRASFAPISDFRRYFFALTYCSFVCLGDKIFSPNGDIKHHSAIFLRHGWIVEARKDTLLQRNEFYLLSVSEERVDRKEVSLTQTGIEIDDIISLRFEYKTRSLIEHFWTWSACAVLTGELMFYPGDKRPAVKSRAIKSQFTQSHFTGAAYKGSSCQNFVNEFRFVAASVDLSWNSKTSKGSAEADHDATPLLNCVEKLY